MNKWGIIAQTIGMSVFFGAIASAIVAETLTAVEETDLVTKPPVQMMDWGDTIRVSLSYLPPEISLYKIKHGSTEIIDCDDHRGYKIPFWQNILVRKDQLPVTLCVIAYDQSDNSSLPWEFAVR